MDSITSACRSLCSQAGLAPTKTNIFNLYVNRVRQNLHVVLRRYLAYCFRSLRLRLKRVFTKWGFSCCKTPYSIRYKVLHRTVTNQSTKHLLIAFVVGQLVLYIRGEQGQRRLGETALISHIFLL